MHNVLNSLAVLIFYNYYFTIPIITYAADTRTLNVRTANETRCTAAAFSECKSLIAFQTPSETTHLTCSGLRHHQERRERPLQYFGRIVCATSTTNRPLSATACASPPGAWQRLYATLHKVTDMQSWCCIREDGHVVNRPQ